MDDDIGRLSRVLGSIEKACLEAGRPPASVRLLAVSKSHSAQAIRRLFVAGQRAFGENRLQEARSKQGELRDLGIEWHFIGPLQTNKTREIAAHFDWVQSVDRPRILERLSTQRPQHEPPLNVCLQVNIDAEPQKSGLPAGEVRDLAALAVTLPGIALRGLMCIPRLHDDSAQTRKSMSRMRALYQQLIIEGYPLDTLSMGMSADYEMAIAEGSTMVRVGTDLFGKRPGNDH